MKLVFQEGYTRPGSVPTPITRAYTFPTDTDIGPKLRDLLTRTHALRGPDDLVDFSSSGSWESREKISHRLKVSQSSYTNTRPQPYLTSRSRSLGVTVFTSTKRWLPAAVALRLVRRSRV